MSAPILDSSQGLRWTNVVELARRGNVPPPRRVEKSDAEWRAALTEEQYRVTRRKGTERPFSSELCALFEPGRYHCICCDTPLFDSTTKFDSGTGWPSFTAPLTPDVVAYEVDRTYGGEDIEANCNVCDAHLGHVFPDGPAPSGLRFCINAVSLRKARPIESP
jgi:peptide-methionine (R)-S-oxide reductase